MTEAFHYPGYVIRLHKERQIQAEGKNLHEKLCTKTISPNQLNIELNTKNKKSSFAFFAVDNICKSNDAHYCDNMKRKQKPTKNGQICKNHESWFYENCLFQEERAFEENKNCYKEQFAFQKINDVNFDINMLSYNLTETKIGRSQKSIFFIKNKYFRVS